MDIQRLDKLQEMAQAWIVACGAPQWLKTQLQGYTAKASFLFDVGRLVQEEHIIDERAVEIVLEKAAREMWLEHHE